MKIYDNKNHVITIDMVGPEREVTLNPGAQHLPLALSPIYALYREFKNSSSAYYRLLCLFKIMEGILGVLRKKGREEAQALGVPFSMPQETVPDHPDISKNLRYLVGKPIKEFYDNVLQKPYRDAASHFLGAGKRDPSSEFRGRTLQVRRDDVRVRPLRPRPYFQSRGAATASGRSP
jgi:hypothetical protein